MAVPKPMSYAMQQEIKRKASLGKELSIKTPEKNAYYKANIPPSVPKAPPAATPTMSYAMTQEIKRKASLGRDLSSSTPQKDAIYKAHQGSIPPKTTSVSLQGTSGSVNGPIPNVIGGVFKPGVSGITQAVSAGASGSGYKKTSNGGLYPAPVIPKYNEAETTNYGTGALANILNSKKYYDKGVANNNAGLKGWASKNAGQYYGQLSEEDAAMVRGMTAQELIDHINSLNKPVEGEAVDEQAPPVVEEPAPGKTFEEMMAEFRAIAEADSAAELAEYERRAAADTEALQRSFDLNNQHTTDQRTMDKLFFDRSNSPFTGQTDQKRDNIGRQWTIEDAALQGDFNSQIAGIQGRVSDYRNNRGQTVEAKAAQLYEQYMANQRADATLTGNYMGARTMAGEELDWNRDANNPDNVSKNLTNEINRLKLQNLPQELKLGLQELEQRVKAGNIDIKAAEHELKELTDPNSLTNRAKKLDMQMKQLEARYMPEEQRLKMAEIRKRTANIGRTKPVSEGDRRMKEITLEKAEIQLDNLKNGKPDKPGKYSYEDDADFGEDLQWIYENPDVAYDQLRKNAQTFQQKYGYDGYQELLKAANG